MQMQETAGNFANRQRLSPVKKSQMCKKNGGSNTKDRSAEKTYRQEAKRDSVVHQKVSGFDSQQCTAKKQKGLAHIHYSPTNIIGFQEPKAAKEAANEYCFAFQGSIINEVCQMPKDKPRQKSRERLCNDNQNLMQSIHQLSNSQLLQNISQGSSSEFKEPAPLSPSKYDYNSAQQSRGHSRAASNFTQNSKVNAKSSASVHSVSPSVNSTSPKKRKADKENQENDEPLIVSARNFIRTEAIGEVLNPQNQLKQSHIDSYNTSPCKSYATQSPQKMDHNSQTFRGPLNQQDDDSVLQESQTVSLPLSPDIDQNQKKVESISPTKFERYLKMDKKSLVNPFKPSMQRNSVANVVKSSLYYVNRADTNRSKGSQTFMNAGQTTNRSSRKDDHDLTSFQDSPDNAVKKLIKTANSKSRERYNYRMTKKISETLAYQSTVENSFMEQSAATEQNAANCKKPKTQRRGKSDRKTSQLKSRPQSKQASPENKKYDFVPVAPRVIEQQSETFSEVRDQSESDAESIQQQTFEGPIVSVIEQFAPRTRNCHTKQPSIGIELDDDPIEVIEEEVEFQGQQISTECINFKNHEASLTYTEMQEEVLKIEQLELDLKQNLDNLQVPQVPAFTSVDSASSNVTSQILTKYAKMMDNIEEEASLSDSHSNALEAPRAMQAVPNEDNYCIYAKTKVLAHGNYDSTATVLGQIKRSRAGTNGHQTTLHSKLASTTSDAAASCHLEEKNYYEQEIDQFKADLRSLEEAEEQVRASPSHGVSQQVYEIDEDEEEPQHREKSPRRYQGESPQHQYEFEKIERGINNEMAVVLQEYSSKELPIDLVEMPLESQEIESQQIYVDESADYDDESNTGVSQQVYSERQVSAEACQDFHGANFPTKENSKDFLKVDHIVVELEDQELHDGIIESERIEHAEFPEGVVGEGLFSNPVEFKQSLDQVDRLETSPSPQKFQETIIVPDHNQLNLSQLQPKDECETPEPTPHFQSSSRQEVHPNGHLSSKHSRASSQTPSELSVERVFSMRIDQAPSENYQDDTHRDEDEQIPQQVGQHTPPPKNTLEFAQIDVPVIVPNIEHMNEKLLEMKSESQTISEQESYKFQLSQVTQSPMTKKSPAKTKRDTTAKKLQQSHSKSPQIRVTEILKSKGKCGSAKKRLTSASPLRDLLNKDHEQPWQDTLRVSDMNPYGSQLSQHLRLSSPGASSGSFHIRPEQVLKQKSPLKARRDRKISPGKSINGKSPVGKDYYDPVLEAKSINSSAKKSSFAGRSPQKNILKMIQKVASNTSDVGSVSTNKFKKERRSRKNRSSSNKSGTSKISKNTKVAQQLAMNCTSNAISSSRNLEYPIERNGQEMAMSQTQRQIQLQDFLINPQIIKGDCNIQCMSSDLDGVSSPEPQPITLSQGMFDHRYGQTEKTHTNFLGDGYSIMSKDFTASPTNIQIPVEGLGEASPEREDKNRTAFKNKVHQSSPSKTSFHNPYISNPKIDTENSDRNSLVNPSKLQQQEEPILDSDDEGLLQPEMHLTSLKSAERINLFPTQTINIQERANQTQVNPTQYCLSFDNELFNNQKNLRQHAIEHAESLLKTEIKQNQYNSNSSYKSDLINLTSQKYQRSFYGEEMNDFNPHEKMSIQENEYDSRSHGSRPSIINSNKKSNKKKHNPTHVSQHSKDQFMSATKIVQKHQQEIQPAILEGQEATGSELRVGKPRSNQVPKLKVIQNVQEMLDCTEVVKQKIASKYNHTINTERTFPQHNADAVQSHNLMAASRSQNHLSTTFVQKRKSATPLQGTIMEQTQQFYSKPEDLRSKSSTKIGQGLFNQRTSKSSEVLSKKKELSSESQQFLKQMNINATNSRQFQGAETIQYFSNSRSSVNGKPVCSNFQSKVNALNLSAVKSQTLTPILNQSYARNTLASSRKSVQVSHVCHQPRDVKPKFHVVRRTQINGTPSKMGLHQKITGVSQRQHTNLMRELQGDNIAKNPSDAFLKPAMMSCVSQGLTPQGKSKGFSSSHPSASKSKSNQRGSNQKAASLEDPINKLTGLAKIKALGKLSQQKK